MKRTTKSILITALILLCAGLLLALSSSLFVKIKGINPYGVEKKYQSIEDKTISLTQLLADSPESNFVKKLSNKEFLRIDLTSFAGDVIIRSAQQTEIELKKADVNNISCKIVGETLVIKEVDPVGFMGIYIDKDGFSFKGLRHMFGLGNTTNAEKTVILNLAEGYKVDQIDINSKIGDVVLDGIDADVLNVSSFIGDVEFKNLKSSESKISVKGNITNVECENSAYNSLSVNTKWGDLEIHVPNLKNLSTVLESWIGHVDVETDIPTTEFKLTFSCALGAISRNGQLCGKELRGDANNPNRITASVLIGNMEVDFSGENEDQYVPVDNVPLTEEAPLENDAPISDTPSL